MKNILHSLILLIISSFIQVAIAQENEAEAKNRAIFNRIEYFFNSQQPDSIYQLASIDFQKKISAEQMNTVLNQLFSLGKIQEATLQTFEEGKATYKVNFEKETLSIVLRIDTFLNYNYLEFKPFQAVPISKKDSVISNVETKSPLDRYVDSIARNYATQSNAQSLSIAIIHKNKINTFFYGETEKGNQTLPDANTLYEIGSITKTFTASLLAELVNTGIISLDDSISKFLPDSLANNPALQKITFKMLANHTSGLPRMADNWNVGPKFNSSDPYAHYNQQLLFSFLKNFQTKTEPETEYLYSNIGYGLLGELLTIISKKPYQQLLKDSVLVPLEMTSTTDVIDPKNLNVAYPHNEKGEKVPFWNFQALSATGSLKSTLNDMLRYVIAQLTYPESAIQKAMNLTKQYTFFVPPNSDIGLAWHMSMMEDVTYYYHTGNTAGSYSFIGFVPDDKSVVIILSNSSTDIAAIGLNLLDKVLKTK
ncbi:serine hydrolase domain-containing protein [Sphingobacterium sp. HJSM2_6]|uniref:serine hydrolase domain-containing protein n=1 Tax=Sphingobacterium sp. HJSM2_6 TaxID=3366264 RepID=UPI003BCD11AC